LVLNNYRRANTNKTTSRNENHKVPKPFEREREIEHPWKKSGLNK
jgi:hypothetical protein